MKRNSYIFIIAFAALLAACAGVPVKDIQVASEAAPKVNFKGYKSYAWLVSAAILHDAEGRWEPPAFDADAEVKFLIDRELRGRGMSETAADPDLVVAFALGVDMDALGLKKDAASSLEILSNVPKTSLVIALIDGHSGQIIWVGVARAEVQEKPDAGTAKARLDYAVTQLLGDIPE